MTHLLPLPWKVEPRTGYDVLDANGHLVANCGGWQESHNPDQHATKQANARLIVQAVNSHEALVEALRRIAAGETGPNAGEVGADLSQAYHAQGIALAALALAEEETP